MTAPDAPEALQRRTGHRVARQRQLLLALLKRWLDPLMAVLGLIWLALLLFDLLRGLTPLLQALSTCIWIVFVVDFLVEFGLAPRKLPYLRHNWLTALSLLAPALRLLRIVRLARLLRAARVTRGLRLLRIVSSVNRGLRALGRHMSRRGLPFVFALTLVVTLAGSAGMYAFEREAPGGGGLQDYGNALWWTAMMVTTMGSEYWPKTPEGRLLCLLLAMYAFSVFGYVTAALASFFVGRDAQEPPVPKHAPVTSDQFAALLHEVTTLRAEVHALRALSTLAAEHPARRITALSSAEQTEHAGRPCWT
ncbi:MAG: potassium channel family protein [Roseateles sp.]|uniref:potassium channel family protein n=1 Tax=Roseateles sp. TaxID=1971397 RepID=UPI004036619F